MTAAADVTAAPSAKRRTLAALAVVLLLALAAMAPALFTAEPLVPGRLTTDLNHFFRHWLHFAVHELRQGNLPLWNPHVYGGQSYVGSFQSALFYPPNVVHLLLPQRWAINAFLLLHLVLAGACMVGWCRSRSLSTAASLVGSAMFMFGASYYLRLQGGHLTLLAAAAWLPLLFWMVDRQLERPLATWVIVGSGAAAMMLLAGHPQTAYQTALAGALYAGIRLFRAAKPWASIGSLLLTAVLAGLIAAVALLPGLESAAQGLRGSGTDPQLAASFSLPPENLLTLLAPTLLGDARTLPYWGRWYYWEMVLYVGMAGLMLAILGAVFGARRQRFVATLLVFVLVVLAMGAYTPLFGVLRDWLPGFDRFRGTAKFAVQASLFLALLGAIGAQRLIDGPGPPRLMVLVAMLGALACAAGAIFLRAAAEGPQVDLWWLKALNHIRLTQQSYQPAEVYLDAGFATRAARHATLSLLASAAMLAVVALLLLVARRWVRTTRWLLAVAIVELVVFAHLSTITMNLDQGWPAELPAVLQRQPANARVLNIVQPNVAMSLGAMDVWGYDPTVSRRYAEFIAFTQGVDPRKAGYAIQFHTPHKLLALLRCHQIIGYRPDGSLRLGAVPDPLPHVLLVNQYKLATTREATFAVMGDPGFDPRQTVVLSEPPSPRPVATAQGTARVVDQSTDHLTIEAELSGAALLLVTDGYDPGWRAEALPGSVQQDYRVLAADHVLRAVPLTAGKHRLRLVYEPRSWQVAKSLTAVGLTLWLGLVLLRVLAMRRRTAAENLASALPG